jgi:hypothetical protein
MSKRIVLTAVIALGALAFASSAFAGGALAKGYGGAAAPAAQVHVKAAKKVTLPKTVKASTLPFTGADLAWFALGASVLVGLGFGLRRVASGSEE